MRKSVQNAGLAALAVIVLAGAAFAVSRTSGTSAHGAPLPLPPITQPTQPPQPVSALFFGDSIMQGAGVPANGPTMATRTAKALGWNVVIDGFGGTGYTTGGIIKGGKPYPVRLTTDPQPTYARYQVVLLEGGTNDRATPRLDVKVRACLAIIRRQQPAAKIILMGPYSALSKPVRPQAVAVDRDLAKLAASEHLDYISPVGEGWLPGAPARFLFSDGFHPTVAGHAYLAKRLTADLRRLVQR